MNLNGFLDIAAKTHVTQQQAAIAQDGRDKAKFALDMMQRMPKTPPPEVEPPRIPTLGALAIPS